MRQVYRDNAVCSGRVKKVLVTGVCGYELAGLESFLTELGCCVTLCAEGEPPRRGGYDMTVVALSAVPLAGWGRYLPWIRAARRQAEGRMVILVPERLRGIRLLKDVGPVYSGYTSLYHLRWILLMALTGGEMTPSEASSVTLTRGQREAMADLYLRMMYGADSLKPGKWMSYFHRARLLEVTGINRLQILCLSGTGLMEDVISTLFRDK